MRETEQQIGGFRYGVRHVTPVSPISLVEFVGEQMLKELNPSLSALELVEMGSVYVDNERCLKTDRLLKAGAEVRIHTSPRRYPCPRDLRDRIVSETSESLVVDKPAGLPVHALVDNVRENLQAYLEDLRRETLYITHRLDVDTSGLVLFAKSADAQVRFNLAFVNGAVKRTYAAYVENPVAPGEYIHFMEPSLKAPKHVSPTETDGWQRCALNVLSCTLLEGETSAISEGRTTWDLTTSETMHDVYLLTIRLQTGRPQQIRAQLAALGSPIIGDASYGSSFRLTEAGSGSKAIALRASALAFDEYAL